MIDNIFGQLEYDFLWEGTTKITMFGENYEIGIGIEGEEEDGITELQKDTYINFMKNETEIIENVCNEIMKYYKHMCQYEPEKIDPNVIGKLPEVKNILELKALITPIKLCIPELDGDREISILFDCLWDFDMGLGVKIINEAVTKVGIQSEVL